MADGFFFNPILLSFSRLPMYFFAVCALFSHCAVALAQLIFNDVVNIGIDLNGCIVGAMKLRKIGYNVCTWLQVIDVFNNNWCHSVDFHWIKLEIRIVLIQTLLDEWRLPHCIIDQLVCLDKKKMSTNFVCKQTNKNKTESTILISCDINATTLCFAMHVINIILFYFINENELNWICG